MIFLNELARVKIGVVIPCYKVKGQILEVLGKIGPEVSRIYVVDDACPEKSGEFVRAQVCDARVRVLTHHVNLGVGGAVITGYRQGLADGIEVMVKIDGDGQMDPGLVPAMVAPIRTGVADYTKGNRFYYLAYSRNMPLFRLLGNAALSFLTKLSCGYWNLVDPTNGLTALHTSVLQMIDMDQLDRRYFFETDMLFRLSLARAVVWDIPMQAYYGEENSSLKISRVLFEFSWKHLNRFVRRVAYNHFIRDFHLGSLLLIVGVLSCAFGTSFGAYQWHHGDLLGVPNTSGTVMLAALPVLIGIQFLLTFINTDINLTPTRPLHPLLLQLRGEAP